jgi:hypothetical protein
MQDQNWLARIEDSSISLVQSVSFFLHKWYVNLEYFGFSGENQWILLNPANRYKNWSQ